MRLIKTLTATAVFASCLGAAPVAMSDLDPETFNVSYRKTVFTILGGNFGPMLSMIKGEIPWDDETFQSHASDLAKTASLDINRAFPDRNDPGKTKARPEIWDNKEDFLAKLDALREESAKLATVAKGNDKKAIMEQFKATGGTCKACHDEYKAKEYL